jgi:hypothetical protein
VVRTARHMQAFEQTAKALDAGDISASHTTIAAQAAKHHRERYREHEDVPTPTRTRMGGTTWTS